VAAVMVVLLSDFDLPIQKPLKPSQWLCKQNAAYSSLYTALHFISKNGAA